MLLAARNRSLVRKALGQARWFGNEAVDFSCSSYSPGNRLRLADVMDRSKPVVVVNEKSSVLDVCDTMTNKKASTVFVEDKGYIVGAVRESDIVHFADSENLATSPVTEIMNRNILYARPSDTIRDSLKLVNSSQHDHLPILTSGGKTTTGEAEVVKVSDVGVIDVNSIISSKTLIGIFYYETMGADVAKLSLEQRLFSENEVQNLLKLPTVKNITKTKQKKSEEMGEMGTMVLNAFVEDKITVADTLCQMTKFGKGSVAIMDVCRDEHRLVGIVTEQDLIRRVFAKRKDIQSTLIADVMTSSNLVTVSTKETLLSCAYKMIEKDVRHLPVLSPKGERVLTMISSKDVVSYLCESFTSEEA